MEITVSLISRTKSKKKNKKICQIKFIIIQIPLSQSK